MKIFKCLIAFSVIVISSLTFASGTLSAQLINTVVALTGNIFDAITREPLTTRIVITDDKGNRINQTRSNSAENGYYYITSLKPGHSYVVNITRPEYFDEKINVSIPNTDLYQEISRDFVMKPKEVGAQIPIPVPPFELNKSKIRYGGDELLESIKNTLYINPGVKFEILCYPDNGINLKENKKLTEERCQSLKEFFVSNGIDSSRITTKYSEKTDPKNPPPTEKRAKGKRYIGNSYIVVTSI